MKASFGKIWVRDAKSTASVSRLPCDTSNAQNIVMKGLEVLALEQRGYSICYFSHVLGQADSPWLSTSMGQQDHLFEETGGDIFI